MKKPGISLVVISHGQAGLIQTLLKSLSQHDIKNVNEIVLIDNLSDQVTQIPNNYPVPISQIVNSSPDGFAANINKAFKEVSEPYFCLVNPDVEFVAPVFPKLINKIQTTGIDIISVLLVDSDGEIQDSFRSVPNPFELIRRYFIGKTSISLAKGSELIYPQWLAAIFMLMRSDTFRKLGGFDEKYYLYFEDVDFGCRARSAGYKIAVDTTCKLIHHPRRASRKNLKYLGHHIRSAIKFYFSSVYREFILSKKKRSD